MLPYEAAYSIVSGAAGSLVSGRIRPDQLDFDDVLPSIVIGIDTETPEDGLSSSFADIFEGRIAIYAETRASVDEIVNALIDGVDGGELSDGDDTWYAFIDGVSRSASSVDTESGQPIYSAEVRISLVRT